MESEVAEFLQPKSLKKKYSYINREEESKPRKSCDGSFQQRSLIGAAGLFKKMTENASKAA